MVNSKSNRSNKSNKSNKYNKSLSNIIFDNKLFKNKVFENIYYLYFLFILTFIVVLNYFFNDNYQAIILFTIIFLFSYYFNKNLSIVLTFSLAILFFTNLLNRLFNKKEGYIGKKNVNETMNNNQDDHDDDDSDGNDSHDGGDGDRDDSHDGGDGDGNDSHDDDEEAGVEPMKMKKKPKKSKSGYVNYKLKPKKLKNQPKTRGKLSDIEKGHNDLSEIMNGNNIKSLSGSTKNMIKQQEEMVKHLNDMTPIVEKAMKTVSDLDLGNLKKVFDGVTSMTGKM